MKKIFTIVGTRPEIIRLSRIIKQLDAVCDHKLIHTGQNYDYELSEIFFDQLDLRKPDLYLDSGAGATSFAETIGKIFVALNDYFLRDRPDGILILGDTNSCLSAYVAKRHKIPVFHMEAGNRCFDFRVPEEINRRIVDHIADINFPYSDIAREYLLNEGIHAANIIKTGSPMREVLDFYMPKINKSEILEKLQLKKDKYFLISLHREENIEKQNFEKFLYNLVTHLDQEYSLPVLVSTHPRTRGKINEDLFDPNLVRFAKPFGYFDYVNLQMNSKAVMSDSGTINEEADILGLKALNLRDSHERPEAMEHGVTMMTGLNIDQISAGLNFLLTNVDKAKSLVPDYNIPYVSKIVVNAIISYIPHVNSKTWFKSELTSE